MKKSYKTLLGLPVLAMATSLLAGCNNSRNNYAYDLDFKVDVKGQTIEMWSGFGSNINDVLDDLLKEFTRLTGVKVKYESKGGYPDCLKAVTLASTSGKYPHVVVGYPDHFASYVKSDIIVRLDYYFENDVNNPTFEPANQKFQISDFYSDYMVENQSIEFKENGDPYTLGVPFNKSTEVLVYNKTFFDYCQGNDGLKDKIYLPSTYAELETVGQNILDFLRTNNVYGKILCKDGSVKEKVSDTKQVILDLTGIHAATGGVDKNAFKPFSYDSQANLFITAIRQNGGTYTEYDKAQQKGYLAFNSDQTKSALTALKSLYDKNIFGIPADWEEASYGSNPFKASKTVMTLGSSAGVTNDATAGNKFQIGAAPVPVFDANKKYVISQGANLALLDKGSREERVASWQLIKFLSKYANGYFCSQTGYYPSCPYAELEGADGKAGMWANYDHDTFDGGDYVSWFNEASAPLAGTSDKIKAEAANVNLEHYIKEGQGWIKFVDPPFPGSATIREEVASIPQAVFYNTKSPADAIADIYSKLKDYVR